MCYSGKRVGSAITDPVSLPMHPGIQFSFPKHLVSNSWEPGLVLGCSNFMPASKSFNLSLNFYAESLLERTQAAA